jgi:hypothetical protein
MRFTRTWMSLVGALGAALLAHEAAAFCGFYVSTDQGPLFNEASKVVIARRGNVTTMTMANDYKGDAKEFAIVIPVPTVVRKDQIRVSESAVIDQIQGFTEPRMAEYFDPDPCPEAVTMDELDYPRPSEGRAESQMMASPMESRSGDLGVRVEASYDVGEYDILILSAKDSSGLETWLHQEGYNIPTGASAVLGSYIKQNMKFFVAKVDLAEKDRLETPFLRPIQVEYESPKFMLPIRLGMVNADGPQDLLVFALTEKGRVETTNYRTTKIPTDTNVPEFVAHDWTSFYQAMFARQVDKHGMETVFLEYAWPLSIQCDPCTGVYLSGESLQKMGAGWASEYHGGVNGGYVTRLHVRYDMAHFPEDLVFQETADQSTFQGRYVITHPFRGDTSCEAGRAYAKERDVRQEQEIANLSALTGWSARLIRPRVPGHEVAPSSPSWWQR